MISKFLEKKVKIEEREIPGKSGNELELEYYLVESAINHSDGLTGDIEYGIEIIKRERGLETESKMFKGIYCSREATQKLMNLLIINTVTPLTLSYILEDTIGI